MDLNPAADGVFCDDVLPPASPCTEWLKTNYVPTLSEASQIRGLLSTSISEIDSITGEIEKYTAILKGLHMRKETLEKHVTEHEALLSPARRLPSDTLRDIFIACLPTKYNAIMSCREAPLLLSLVCKGWREIVLATPPLWSSLHIAIPDDPDTYKIRYEGLKLWLDRSGGCALLVSISQCPSKTRFQRLLAIEDDQVPVAPNSPVETLCSMLTAVFVNTKRLRSLHLHLPINVMELLARELTGDGPVLPMLQSFKMWPDTLHDSRPPGQNMITWRHKLVARSRDILHDFIAHAPRLSGLALGGSDLFLRHNTGAPVGEITPSVVTGAWCQFTTLDLKMLNLSCRNVLGIFARSRNLVKCSVVIYAETNYGLPAHLNVAAAVPLETVTLEYLEELSVTAHSSFLPSARFGDVDPQELFSHLRAPALVNLTFQENLNLNRQMYHHLDLSHPKEMNPALAFTPFHTLLKLTIKGVIFTEELLLELLSQIPLLTSLELSDSDVHVPKAMDVTQVAPVPPRSVVQFLSNNLYLVPQLSTFKINPSDSLKTPEIIDLARARSPKAGGQLRCINIRIHTTTIVQSPLAISQPEKVQSPDPKLLDLELDKIFEEEGVFVVITLYEKQVLARVPDSVWAGVDSSDMPLERRNTSLYVREDVVDDYTNTIFG